ncbi:MAG: hypothetical protein H7249_05130 [Chitinophagaceae bacterium]|nr:hypothetical protein [Oligoflexus sp.]
MQTKLAIILVSTLLFGCQKNVFQPVDKAKPADQATAYMNDHQPDLAISTLNEAMKNDPNNFQLVSLMASAKAQKAGIDTFNLVVKLATSGVSGSNGLTAMFSVLPAVDANNRGLMLEVVNLLQSIPQNSRTNEDNFKATIFNAAFTALQAKFFDQNGDGQYTVDELKNLDDTSANAIINSLLDAQNSAVLYQGAAANGVAAGKVQDVVTQLEAQPGATNADKLRNYLASHQTPVPSLQMNLIDSGESSEESLEEPNEAATE